MTEQKTCLACQKIFTRRPAPLDSAFRWMRRKYCSVECARSTRHTDLSGPAQKASGKPRGDRRTPAVATRPLVGGGPSASPHPGPGLGATRSTD